MPHLSCRSLSFWVEIDVSEGRTNLHKIAGVRVSHYLTMTQAEFFAGIKEEFGIAVPEKDWDKFAVSAALVVNDLRYVHLRHHDHEMVESSCLHFLGDDAQIWWRKRNEKRIMPPSICNVD